MVGGSEVETPVAPAGNAAETTPPASHARPAAQRPRRWIQPVAFAVAAVALFLAYLRQAQTVPVIADGGSFALQAWDMLHGNVLLHGWTTADLSFYTTELPQYALVELIHGLNADVVHIAAAMTYTLLVLGAAVLARGGDPPTPPREAMAKGHASGREGVVRMLVAAGIMLAPSLGTGSSTLLSNSDHTGTQVPMLVIWLILDRARPRVWVPVVVGLLLAWVQVADPLVLYEGVIPLVLVCLIRAYRRHGTQWESWRESWFELALAAGAIVSAGVAAAALKVIHYLHGFILQPPTATFVVVDTMYRNVWVAVESVLLLFGADFSGEQLGKHAAIALVHLAGVALAVWAFGRALRRFGTQDLVVQLLAVTAVVLLATFVLRGNPNVAGSAHEIAGVLPIGAVLAGRLLGGPLVRARLIPVLALGLACYLVILAHNVVQLPPNDPNGQLAAWLQAHHLRYGLADYWNANTVTLDSRDQVQLRYVSRVGDKLVKRPWETEGSWYDPAQHDATFLVTPGPVKACTPGTQARWQAVATAMYGPPSATYKVDGFTVLVWNKNLLSRLGSAPMHGPIRC
jgi:hypothetical protein